MLPVLGVLTWICCCARPCCRHCLATAARVHTCCCAAAAPATAGAHRICAAVLAWPLSQVYYLAGCLLHYVAPRMFHVKTVQVAQPRKHQVAWEAAYSIGE